MISPKISSTIIALLSLVISSCEQRENEPVTSNSEKAPTQTSYIEAGNDEIAVLWDSERSRNKCAKEVMMQIDAQIKLIKLTDDFVAKGDRTQKKVDEYLEREAELERQMIGPSLACREARMGNLTSGTKVDIIIPSGECGSTMNKVHVLMGKHRELVGCVLTEDIQVDQEKMH